MEKQKIKVFISQPMKGLNEKEILETRNRAMREVEAKFSKCQIEFLSGYTVEKPDEDAKNIAVWYLGRSIKILSQADYAYFTPGWKAKRGCCIEHAICERYGIKVIND